MNSSPVFAARNFSDSSVLAAISWDSAPNYPLLRHANLTPCCNCFMFPRCHHNPRWLLCFWLRRAWISKIVRSVPPQETTSRFSEAISAMSYSHIFPLRSQHQKETLQICRYFEYLNAFFSKKTASFNFGSQPPKAPYHPTCFPKSISIVCSDATSHENGNLN